MFRLSRSAVVLRGVAILATSFSLVACLEPSSRSISRPSPADSVNVGYGYQDRRDLTLSVASLDAEAVSRGTPTTVADLIDGRFAGVIVNRLGGGRISVQIRGARSFINSEPLYVIDGVPQSADVNSMLADINPADIKRIDVLKDAAATAVYGSRGANGVILITLKRQY
jgi:TonB-dependent starch-binding outer membrane protein SusC